MKNTVDNKTFYTEEWFEITEMTENISMVDKIIALWNKWKALVSGSKNAVSDVLIQDQNSDIIIDKEKILTVTEQEFRRWEAQPHIELPIIDEKTVEVAFRPELPKKWETLYI